MTSEEEFQRALAYEALHESSHTVNASTHLYVVALAGATLSLQALLEDIGFHGHAALYYVLFAQFFTWLFLVIQAAFHSIRAAHIRESSGEPVTYKYIRELYPELTTAANQVSLSRLLIR